MCVSGFTQLWDPDVTGGIDRPLRRTVPVGPFPFYLLFVRKQTGFFGSLSDLAGGAGGSGGDVIANPVIGIGSPYEAPESGGPPKGSCVVQRHLDDSGSLVYL